MNTDRTPDDPSEMGKDYSPNPKENEDGSSQNNMPAPKEGMTEEDILKDPRFHDMLNENGMRIGHGADDERDVCSRTLENVPPVSDAKDKSEILLDGLRQEGAGIMVNRDAGNQSEDDKAKSEDETSEMKAINAEGDNTMSTEDSKTDFDWRDLFSRAYVGTSKAMDSIGDTVVSLVEGASRRATSLIYEHKIHATKLKSEIVAKKGVSDVNVGGKVEYKYRTMKVGDGEEPDISPAVDVAMDIGEKVNGVAGTVAKPVEIEFEGQRITLRHSMTPEQRKALDELEEANGTLVQRLREYEENANNAIQSQKERLTEAVRKKDVDLANKQQTLNDIEQNLTEARSTFRQESKNVLGLYNEYMKKIQEDDSQEAKKRARRIRRTAGIMTTTAATLAFGVASIFGLGYYNEATAPARANKAAESRISELEGMVAELKEDRQEDEELIRGLQEDAKRGDELAVQNQRLREQYSQVQRTLNESGDVGKKLREALEENAGLVAERKQLQQTIQKYENTTIPELRAERKKAEQAWRQWHAKFEASEQKLARLVEENKKLLEQEDVQISEADAAALKREAFSDFRTLADKLGSVSDNIVLSLAIGREGENYRFVPVDRAVARYTRIGLSEALEDMPEKESREVVGLLKEYGIQPENASLYEVLGKIGSSSGAAKLEDLMMRLRAGDVYFRFSKNEATFSETNHLMKYGELNCERFVDDMIDAQPGDTFNLHVVEGANDVDTVHRTALRVYAAVVKNELGREMTRDDLDNAQGTVGYLMRYLGSQMIDYHKKNRNDPEYQKKGIPLVPGDD